MHDLRLCYIVAQPPCTKFLAGLHQTISTLNKPALARITATASTEKGERLLRPIFPVNEERALLRPGKHKAHKISLPIRECAKIGKDLGRGPIPSQDIPALVQYHSRVGIERVECCLQILTNVRSMVFHGQRKLLARQHIEMVALARCQLQCLSQTLKHLSGNLDLLSLL